MKTNLRLENQRPLLQTILRILTGILLLGMSALPVSIIIHETVGMHELVRSIREMGDFFGNQASGWILAGFLAGVPLFGLYLIIEAVVSRLRNNAPSPPA